MLYDPIISKRALYQPQGTPNPLLTLSTPQRSPLKGYLYFPRDLQEELEEREEVEVEGGAKCAGRAEGFRASEVRPK